VVFLILTDIDDHFRGRSGIQHIPSRLSIDIGSNSSDVKAMALSIARTARDAKINNCSRRIPLSGSIPPAQPSCLIVSDGAGAITSELAAPSQINIHANSQP
jgi:hypothetical protein